ncbi:MAG: hypothetical protein HYZ75_05150 [Elusimicrobia bacterium]|nr:hypothetical protein [Elusimicrobiota bacterium]
MAGEPLSDAEVLALKECYRGYMYRAAAVIALAGLFSVFLVASIQATLLRGPRPVFLWGPVAIELLALVLCLGRRRLALVVVCAAFAIAQFRIIPKAGELHKKAQETRSG